MFFYDCLCLFCSHFDVGDLFLAGLVDFNYGLVLTDAYASGLGNGNLVREIFGVKSQCPARRQDQIPNTV